MGLSAGFCVSRPGIISTSLLWQAGKVFMNVSLTQRVEHRFLAKYGALLLLAGGILAIFSVRTALAAYGNPPRLNDLFTALILAGSVGVSVAGRRLLHRSDWAAAALIGALVGLTMLPATLYSPYPFFGIVSSNLGQALVRGFSTTLAMLGGLVIMRQGGPVQVLSALGEWRRLGRGLLFGLALGLPLAVVNVFALQLTQGRPIAWQNPLAAALDALQPGIVEEAVYRFAFLGLLWLALRKPLPRQAAGLSALLVLLAHSYGHFDDLLLAAPLAALGMGLALLVLWGLPLTYLALRRGLEPAVAFHWLQDALRFLAGY